MWGVEGLEFQGGFFKACRFLVRRYTGPYAAPERDQMHEPAVYICRHHNVKGPLLSLAHIKTPVHTWVFHVFCDRKKCYEHCRAYTFSERFRWSRPKVEFLARIISPFFAALVNSSGAIAVYRDSLRVVETFRRSVDALSRGESLLIFPDIDYVASAPETGALYDGFLVLEHIYRRRTGEHVRFVPLHVSNAKRLLAVGNPICFAEGADDSAEKDRVLRNLHGALNELSERYGE